LGEKVGQTLNNENAYLPTKDNTTTHGETRVPTYSLNNTKDRK